ncbi:sigma-70 family RNA polymerase sigma factor [Acidicapsa acidisoli]|uniref:sigma-70 family RNA polymerase sigma factor n=1 Tax=Acidicapsa acidisoli TaxID=1615681 RepID=UPI0037BF1BDA
MGLSKSPGVTDTDLPAADATETAKAETGYDPVRESAQTQTAENASNTQEQEDSSDRDRSEGARTDRSEESVPASTGPAKTQDAGAEGESAEAVILARAQSGDHAAFAQLYSAHKRRVYSLCLRMLGNVAEAEDLTQESFLQLHRKIATFRGDSAFSTWLHRLTINVVLMHLRRKGLNLISLDEALDPSPDHGPARSFGAPDLRLTGSIDRMTLEKAVESLPAGYRLIFVLHDIEGYEHNEIATLLDCSIGNSKSQLHKARMKLREALRAPADEEMAK